MLYTIYIKKNQKDTPNILRKIVEVYYRGYPESFVLGWPGYIGKTTTTIDDFCKIFTNVNANPQGFFFDPLNILMLSNNQTNIAYQNRQFGSYNLNQKSLKDHSKILTFVKFNSVVTSQNIQSALKNKQYSVDCVIIGSSNQSDNTYCNTSARKGEMDVCMLEMDDTDQLSEFIMACDINTDSITVSQEIVDITRTNLTTVIDNLLRTTLR